MPSAGPGCRRDERGASGVEYALLVALIAAVVVGAALLLGEHVLGLFDVAEDPHW